MYHRVLICLAGTTLIKIFPSAFLHRRLKTVAASLDKRIPDYVLEVLEQHVPKQINLEATVGSEKPEGQKEGKKGKRHIRDADGKES
jgi:hypothetical protein